MTDEKTTISIALSQEELFVLMTYLEIPEILGFDPSAFNELSKEEMTVAMAVAERGLFARGLIEQRETKIVPTDLIRAILGTCSGPETMLVISISIPGQVGVTNYFHTARKMVVYHYMPVIGIHQFIAMQNVQAMQKAAFSLLQVKMENGAALPLPPGCIPEDLMRQAKEAADQGGKDAAVAVLAQSDLASETRQALADALAEPQATVTIVRVSGLQESSQHYGGFTLLHAKDAMWLLHPVEKGPQSENAIDLKTTDPEEVTRVFQSLFLTT